MIRVVVADDHPIVREGLRRVLHRAHGIEVAAETGTGEGLADLVQETRADVVLLDISMPGPGFVDIIPVLTAGRSRVRVLVLSGHPEEDYALRALRAGAAGYLNKSSASAQLVDAVRCIHGGRRYLSESLAQRLALRALKGDDTPRHLALSSREYKVFELMVSGLSLKEIAGQLGVHPKTISTYRTRILSKLGLKSNAQLVRYALEHDLLPR